MKISEFERPLEAMQPLLQRKSQEIISFVARELKTEHGVSSMSSAIYDTAWVSLVSRFIEGQPTWTFPESFHYILHAQLPDGGWEAYNTGCDGILNTAAALLALKEHDVNSNYRGCSIDVNLKGRIERASDALQQRLDKWSIDSNLPVGFEILLPAILRLLEEHELRYSFPHCQALMQTEKQKLSKFRPEILYAPMTTTLVHSLEGFIGKVDFDKLGHHVVRGSMMNSPSSTAAYLIHSSTYNLECEDYLKDAIAFGEGLGRGSVPSAFPSTTFEVSWVLATLLEAGFNPGEVDQGHCSTITTYLADELSVGKGITGFSPGVMSDADDTALSIESLLLSGISIDPAEMIKTFGKTSHFITYAHERDPSISANCNILIALLTSENCQIYMDQIAIALNFLIDKWNGRCFADKWNHSVYYPMMRLSKAIALLLRKFDPASPDKTSSTLLTPSILILLTQVLLRLLSDQNTDGSWGRGHFPEETAYALLALKSISPLSWTELFGGKIQDSIAMATTFLESKADQWHEANYLWTEKVTYKSSLLSQAYCIAALKTTYSIATRVSNYNPNPVQTTQILELATFLKSLPQFADQESWNLLLSVVEGCFLFSKFQATHIDIFPFEAIYNRYMMYIPITLVAVNNLRKHGSRLSNEQLWDMIISFSLSYEIEFYIQKQASTLASTEILELQDFVSAVLSSHRSKQPSFKRQKIEPSNSSNGFDTSIRTNGIHQSNQCDGIYDGNQSDKTNKRKATDSTIEAVQSKLAAYVSHITQHSSILSSPARVQARQRQDLKAFLLAHLQSAADQQGPNIQRSNSNPNASLVREPLFSWLHESAAIKTGIPHTFTFLTVITTPENIILFSTPTSQYYADVLRTHLAAAYRLRDDYDNIETYMMGGKLSSLHWLKETKDTKEYCDKVKSMISDLAAFEDQTWQAALLKLEDELGVGKLMGMRIYLDFVNIFGRVCSSRILDGAAQDDV